MRQTPCSAFSFCSNYTLAPVGAYVCVCARARILIAAIPLFPRVLLTLHGTQVSIPAPCCSSKPLLFSQSSCGRPSSLRISSVTVR
jgi:hypothetical protein